MISSTDGYEKYRCTQHQRAPLDLKGERDNNTIVVGFNTPITTMDRVSG